MSVATRRLQDADDLFIRIGAIAALLFTLLIFWASPHTSIQPFGAKQVRDTSIANLDDVEIVQEQADTQVVQKPKAVEEATDEEAEEDETIADTNLDLNKNVQDTDIPPPDAFIPFSDPPITVSKPAPAYPELAQKAGLEGTVYVKVYVDKNGDVKSVVLLKGVSEALDKAALEAAWRAKFKPAVNNGTPVAVWYGLSYKFTLHN